MSDQVNKLSGKVSLDMTDYKASIGELNRQIRVIESGFKATAATMGEWDKSASGLETRNKSLSQVIDLQKQKVANLQKQYKDAVAQHGENSRAAEELQIKINRESEALNKNETELKKNQQALDETKNGFKDLGDEVETAEKKSVSFKDVLGGLGKALEVVGKVVAAVGAAATAAVTGLIALITKSAAAADNLVETADKTGLTVQQLQELDYISKQVGTDTDVVQSSMARLIRSMASAKDGTGTQAEAFKTLGVDVADVTAKLKTGQELYSETVTKLKAMKDETKANSLSMQLFGVTTDQLNPKLSASRETIAALKEKLADAKKGVGDNVNELNKLNVSTYVTNSTLKSNQEVFAAVLQKLREMPNETERDALAMQIFGKSAQELNGLIKATPEEIDAMISSAHDLGAVMSDETVQKLADFNDYLDSVKSSISGLSGTIAGDLLPMIQGIGGNLTGYLQGLSDVAKNANGDIGKLTTGLGTLLGRVVSDLVKQLPTLMSSGLNIVSGIVDAVVKNLPVLGQAAYQIVKNLLDYILTEIPKLIPSGIMVVSQLLMAILHMLPELLQGAVTIITTLATGLSSALPQLIPAIIDVVMALIDGLLDALPQIIDAAIQIVQALATGMINALPKLISKVPELISKLVLAIIANLPTIIEAAVQIIVALALGFIQSIPLLIAAIPQIIQALAETFESKEFQTQMGDLGKQMIDGIVTGVGITWRSFLQNWTTSWSALLDSIKGLAKTKAGEAVISFVTGIGTKVSTIVQAGKDLVNKFAESVKEKAVDILALGASIVDGVWQGIKSKAEEFYSNVKNFFEGIVKQVKSALKIQSPSQVFADIGQMMVAGLDQGFGTGITDFEAQLRNSIAGMTAKAAAVSIPVNINSSGAAQQVTSGGKTYQLYVETFSEAALSRSLKLTELLYG